MNGELPLYQGAMPQAAQQQFAQVPQLPRMQMYGGQLDNAIAAGLEAVDKFADLHDFGVRQEAEHRMRQNELEMQQEFERKCALAPGAEGSFFAADGHLNEDAVAVFSDKWQQRNREVARPYWKRENAMRGEEDVLARNDQLAGNVGLGLLKMESRHREQVFNDNYDLAMAQGDMTGACRIVDDAVASGQITSARGQVMKLNLTKRALRSAGGGGGAGSSAGSIAPVSIGGIMYDDGASAALAAEVARDGGGMVQGKAGEAGSLPLPSDASSAGGAVSDGAYEEAVPMADVANGGDVADGVDGNVGAFAGGGEAGAPLDSFFRSGDFAGVLPLVGQRDFADFTDSMGLTSICVRGCPQDDGRVVFSCSAAAPEVVERAAAHANEAGELTANDARAMVTRISFSLLSDNPDASNEQLSKVFDASGVFESLGDGDPEVGKVRALGIVGEVRQRASAGTLKVSMESIEKVVDAHVNGLWIEERQSDQLRNMDPKLNVKDKWDKSDLDKDGRRRWFALYEVYGKHRAEYLRDRGKEVPQAPLDKDEFEPLAQDFYNWFMPRAKARAKARRAAVRDWYMAEIMRKLTDHVRSNNGQMDYGVSYANDMEVVRDVLQQEAPADLGENALMKMRTESALADKKRTDAYRKQAAEDFARLQALKSYTKEHDEKAQRAKKRAEEAEARRCEKEFAKQEKAEESRRARLLNAERVRPRRSAWVWDRRNAAFGESPACTIPEAQHRELVEALGFDGSQVVYLQINGSKIRVDGVNKSGHIELNTPAVCKIQKKPNAKKGERWSYSGQLGYSYHFQTISSK